jgi:hypothetical protein
MSELKVQDGSMHGERLEAWHDRPVASRANPNGLMPAAGWVIGGLAAAGLAYVAWRHFGPDLRRYLKMEMM